jgi:flagellar hook protein FlgE
MSLQGMMRTGTAGMNAQASRLSSVADNIANSATTGYKAASTSFSSLVLPSTGGNYNSGSVQSTISYNISEQGALEYTSSNTDLAISGDGFFIVQDSSGSPFLTRAGSFTANAEGQLVNSAGYILLGYSYAAGDPTPVVNGYDGLVPVTVTQGALTANASTSGSFVANLDSAETAVAAASTPAAIGTTGTPTYTHKSSLVAYDSLGNEQLFDFYYTKTADNTWEVSVFDNSEASSGGPFPYASGPLATGELDFDPTTGKLSSSSVDNSVSFTVPGGEALTVDLSNMTQYSYDFNVQSASVNGNAPSAVDSIQVSTDGTVYAKYKNGNLDPLYRIAMATVESPDKLTVVSGNVYQQGVDSGVITTGFAGSSNFGKIVSGALESSNVDIASELTTMIESQRSYTANSKVFQTGSDLMDVLVNLKR